MLIHTENKKRKIKEIEGADHNNERYFEPTFDGA